MPEEKINPQEQTKETSKKSPEKNGSDKKFKIVSLLLALFIIATAALGGLSYVISSSAKKQQSTQQEEIAKLEQAKKDLEEQLKKAKEDAKAAKSSASSACTDPTSADLENIKAAINTGNTAALEGYMAETVTVIYAASEGVGPQTPAQAVADLEYLAVATTPWNFSLPEATISAWASGGYSSYISTDSIVGKSANNYVVAFSFDCDGNIDTIFMAANSALL